MTSKAVSACGFAVCVALCVHGLRRAPQQAGGATDLYARAGPGSGGRSGRERGGHRPRQRDGAGIATTGCARPRHRPHSTGARSAAARLLRRQPLARPAPRPAADAGHRRTARGWHLSRRAARCHRVRHGRSAADRDPPLPGGICGRWSADRTRAIAGDAWPQERSDAGGQRGGRKPHAPRPPTACRR